MKCTLNNLLLEHISWLMFCIFILGNVSPKYSMQLEGGTLKISCDSNYPVRWYFRNKLPVRDAYKSISDNKYILEIKSVSKHHSGLYTCEGRKGLLKEKFLHWSYLHVYEANSTGRLVGDMVSKVDYQ